MLLVCKAPNEKNERNEIVENLTRRKTCRELYTIWLFTFSDLKTIVIPTTAFGIIGALPGTGLNHGGLDQTIRDVLQRTPLVALWVWLVLLPFNIDNQRRPASVEEDKLNRPWRPLPSGRVTPNHAMKVMLVGHIAAVWYSLVVGGLCQCLLGILLGWIYNGYGADQSFFGKNCVNALGYVTFSTGAMSVATHGKYPTVRGIQWFAILAGVIFTTVQVQDLPDIQGDVVRGRRTGPVVMGDTLCRWSIAILVPIWTAVALVFWDRLQHIGLCAVFYIVAAAAVSWRVIFLKTEDRVTFFIWNLWIVSLDILPLF